MQIITKFDNKNSFFSFLSLTKGEEKIIQVKGNIALKVDMSATDDNKTWSTMREGREKLETKKACDMIWVLIVLRSPNSDNNK